MAVSTSWGTADSEKSFSMIVEAFSRDVGTEISTSSIAVRMLVCRSFAAINARYASVVMWNPTGTGKSVSVNFVKDNPLPPTFSRVAEASERGSM
jgi:hypothetical protein